MNISGIKTLLAAIVLACAGVASHEGQARSRAPAQVPAEDEAPIALLVDLTSGQTLFERNADRRFVPASITKVMTLYQAFELMKAGNLAPGQVITMREESWKEWSRKGSTMFLPQGARVRVDDLLAGIATVSANDGSIALAEGYSGSVSAWVDAMNATARNLGMTDSHFGTPNGWPDDGATFTTARDLVRLAEAMIERHPRKYAHYIGRPQYEYNGITQPNRDPTIGRVRGADGIKTGFTNEAGFGFLGSAKRDGRRLVLVIAGVERNTQRARLSRQLLEWGFNAFDQRQIANEGEVVGSARVQGGSARRVDLIAERQVYVNVPAGTPEGDVKLTIRYDGPVRAPIEAGERMAELEIIVPDMEPATVPLIASEKVEKAGPLMRIFNGLMGWLT